MRPLEDRSRLRLLRLSAGLCTASLLLAPMAGRTALGLSAERQVFDRRITVPSPLVRKSVRISLLRDPFRPETEPAASRQAMQSLPVVRAVVTGRDAAALVEDGGTTRIVRVGDTVGGQVVRSIDAFGVHFETGAVSAATVNSP